MPSRHFSGKPEPWPVEGGEKTEEPTQKKLDDALKRGDVAKSQELNVWFGLAAATLSVSMFGDQAVSSLGRTLTRFLAHPETIAIDGASLTTMTGGLGLADRGRARPADAGADGRGGRGQHRSSTRRC